MEQATALKEAREAMAPFVHHDWIDADLEDDNCRLLKWGNLTCGDLRRLQRAFNRLLEYDPGRPVPPHGSGP